MPDPRRGEVWLIDFGLAGKSRPALVVSVAFGVPARFSPIPKGPLDPSGGPPAVMIAEKGFVLAMPNSW